MTNKPRLMFLLLLAALAASATARTTMNVPAVAPNGGGMLANITAWVEQGDGKVFIDIRPYFSIETQQSGRAAVTAAARLAGVERDSHNYFYEVAADAELVDGPSGGAAMALLTYSELKGIKPRKDLCVSGAISTDGSVGKVGGLIDKAKAAAEAGIKVFVVPTGQAVQDDIDLETYAPQEWGMQVVEAQTLAEVVGYAFTPEGSTVEAKKHGEKPLNLTPLTPSQRTLPLKEVAVKSAAAARESLGNYESKFGKTLFYNRTAKALENGQYLLDRGYYYSSANAVFVAKIAVDAQLLANESRTELDARLKQLEERARNLVIKNKTLENLEWTIGAQLRLYWAKDRLDSLDKEGPLSSTGTMAAEIASAESWLDAAGDLNIQASGGTPIAESRLRSYADNLLKDAETALAENPESEGQSHLNTAKLAFAEGDYATAAFDASFAIAFSDAAAETYSPDATVESLLNLTTDNETPRDSIWAELYYGHSLYNLRDWNRTGDSANVVNALKLQYLADDLDQRVQDIPNELENQSPGGGPAGAGSQQGNPLNVTIERVPSTSGGSGNLQLLGFASALVIIAALAAMLYFLRKPTAAPDDATETVRKLDKLDDMLTEGRISEDNYDRLRKKLLAATIPEKPAKTGQTGRTKQGAGKAGKNPSPRRRLWLRKRFK